MSIMYAIIIKLLKFFKKFSHFILFYISCPKIFKLDLFHQVLSVSVDKKRVRLSLVVSQKSVVCFVARRAVWFAGINLFQQLLKIQQRKIHVVNLTFFVHRSTRFCGFYRVSVKGLFPNIRFKEDKRQNAFAHYKIRI